MMEQSLQFLRLPSNLKLFKRGRFLCSLACCFIFDNKLFIMFQVFLIIMFGKEKPDLVSSLLFH